MTIFYKYFIEKITVKVVFFDTMSLSKTTFFIKSEEAEAFTNLVTAPATGATANPEVVVID